MHQILEVGSLIKIKSLFLREINILKKDSIQI